MQTRDQGQELRNGATAQRESGPPTALLDSRNWIGTICEIGPDGAKVNLPRSASIRDTDENGQPGLGDAGQFVCIEARDEVIFGRIVEVSVPETERLTVDPDRSDNGDANAIGTVHLLTSLSADTRRDLRGVGMLPLLGANVYAAEPELVTWISCGSATGEDHDATTLELGHLTVARDEPVQLDAGQLFGRHCAVLGTSGSGKSWTIARLLEQASSYDAKIVLLDATGEFHTLNSRTMHVHIGEGQAEPKTSLGVTFPYSELVEDDLFALFTPGTDVQAPRMRAAIKSLKLAAILGPEHDLVVDGCIPKAGRSKDPFNREYATHGSKILDPAASFDIEMLPHQIELECIWPSTYNAIQGTRDHTVWGEENSNDVGLCDSLMSRIQGHLQAEEFRCLFKPQEMDALPDVLDQFMDSDSAVMRISMKNLSYTLHVREIVANAIGRLLLRSARADRFREQPAVVVLDEAHQFLNKSLGAEHSRYPLDAFELIAKEGRKYSLTVCLCTQRPGDIPEGVLSQVGTQIVHRLVNRSDREAVEQGITHLDHSAARFLPGFAPGEAVIVGTNLSVPLSVQMLPPNQLPDSGGADYDRYWRAA
jgi:hypothetical protein